MPARTWSSRSPRRRTSSGSGPTWSSRREETVDRGQAIARWMRSQIETLEAPPGLKSRPGRLELERLGNGRTVCLLENPHAPVVTSALFYRAGTRDEAPGHGGTVYSLYQMMVQAA